MDNATLIRYINQRIEALSLAKPKKYETIQELETLKTVIGLEAPAVERGKQDDQKKSFKLIDDDSVLGRMMSGKNGKT